MFLWTGELADGSGPVKGLRKLRSPCSIATLVKSVGREPWQQNRNETSTPAVDDDAC